MLYFLSPVHSRSFVDVLHPQSGFLLDRRGQPYAASGHQGPVLLDAAGFCAVAKAHELPGDGVFVEYHPAIDGIALEDFAQVLAALPPASAIVLVTGDMACALELAKQPIGLAAVALKSCEAAGLGSHESAGVLFDNARRRLAGSGLPLMVWGGVATPEAAAAFLATGAVAVVVEHAHWLTADMGLSEGLRGKLAALKFETSSVVPTVSGLQWRFFDRGNSSEVRRVADLPAPEAIEAVGVGARTLAASSLSAGELIPLGADAPFAAGFIRRFGQATVPALNRFTDEALRLWAGANVTFKRFLRGSTAHELGVRLPFIQGAMSWISDRPDFALAVAKSGALPTLAVGMRTAAQLDQDFGRLGETMQNCPYALNVLVLPENPHRDEQLAWLRANRPPLVAVAAGDPAFAGSLRKEGHEVIYLAADIGLMRLALMAGVRFVVLEGSEAGGHVGRRTLLELAQEQLMLRRTEPGLFRDAHIVLAGGICDGPSALRAALLGADAIQMGTVYLATEEIVATGALSPIYQQEILAATLGSTRISGESVGLRVRALNTPKVQAICALEQQRAKGGLPEQSFRKELELLSAGSLQVAAKGLRQPGGPPLSPEECRLEGQFMSGAVAANVDRIRSLAAVHEAIAAVAAVRAPGVQRTGGSWQAGQQRRIAITGMAMANSLGDNVDAVVEASLAGKSGIGTVPKDRWDHSRYHTPNQVRQGTTYTDVGAFMQVDLSRKRLGVSPQDYRTMSMSTKLTLFLARRAIEASGLAQSLVPGARVAVLTSQNSAEVASTVHGQLFSVYADEIGEIAWRGAELTQEQRADVALALVQQGLAVDDTTLIGRLNCTASGHICNMYGFGGPSYSVGAACASSLIALYNAVLLIRAGLIDAAVVGGGEELLTPVHYLEFSALRALAGVEDRLRIPAEYSRPFDRDRDGFVLGEGGAVVVLERESLARERGAPIHALITGVGACTNHQGIVESVAESQMLAMEASYTDAGYGLDQVDLVECHGTGTIQGDREEVKALAAMLSGQLEPGGTVLSSFKAQIGHTLGASGISSLIRGIGAMRRGMYPPTNSFSNPAPGMGMQAAGFRVLQRAEPWARPSAERGRRMQVNAFGFGGACVVVQVEAPSDQPDIPFEASEDEDAPFRPEASFLLANVAGRDHRLGVSCAPERVAELLRSSLAEGLTPAVLARLGRQGVFLAPADEPPQPLALIFSGQGMFYKGMGRDISRAHPVVAQTLKRLALCADYDLLGLLFDTDEERLRDTRWQQPALFAFEYALASQLLAFGLKPAAVAGHSLGEFTALTVAGVLTPEDAFRVVDMRARCMAKASGLAEAPGVMAAIGLPVDVLQWKLAKYPGVVITNYNTPKQVVVGGAEALVRALVAELKTKGSQATVLNVSMAFHSPVMRVIRDEFADFLAGVNFTPPTIPVLSNVLKGTFPDDPADIRQTMVEHLESPVHWTQNVYYLWSELGIRRFVEVGPDAVLGNLVRDIEAEAQTIRTASREAERPTFHTALANLYAWGDLAPPAVPALLNLGQPGAVGAAPGSGRAVQSARQDSGAELDVLERTIRIIMDATGYEREEIEPDMDLRQDLAIRSSRLPVIMDTAERAFGLSFRIEDFIDVHTVRQMAAQVETMLAGKEAKSGGSQDRADVFPGKSVPPAPASSAAPLPVVRYEAGETPLAAGTAIDLGDLSGKSAWVLGQPGSPSLEEIGRSLAATHGLASGIGGLDAAPVGPGHPACLVLTLEQGAVAPGTAEAVDALLLHCFRRLKEFIASPARKACVLILREAPHGAPERVVFEGVLGMLLTLAQEYGSLAWRALHVAHGVNMAQAVTEALSMSGPVERMVRGGGVSTPQYLPMPLAQACDQGSFLRKGDVLLVSGGAMGVTFRLLESLAPLGPHFVLLGRSPAGAPQAEAVERLQSLGASAEYLSCDVALPTDVARAVSQVAAARGRVDGVIHGAGILRDKFLSMMSEADFQAVCQVKLGGLRNLMDAAAPHGLRLGVAFSSVAAWQGNAGQGNYCCANRAMGSLLVGLKSAAFTPKLLWLPPVAGVGMAESQDIREMMELKGLGQAYVHVDELAPLAAREIACPESSGASVLIARTLPQTATVAPLRQPKTEAEAGLALPVENAPMLDSALLTGLSPRKAVCTRRVSHARDLWLPEHRPYQALSAPLFSAVMVVEIFCEAALALYPFLTPLGVQDMHFLDMLSCPENQVRDLTLSVSCAGNVAGLVVVDAQLESEDVSPKGRPLGRLGANFAGRVVLGAANPCLEPLPGFGVGLSVDQATSAGPEVLVRHYEDLTAQTGRYRVIEKIAGVASDAIRGAMRYRLSTDVAGTTAPLRTSPYLLEALMQLVLFHGLLHAGSKAQDLLPVGIGSMRFARLCQDGERFVLEARLREQSPGVQVWDACGFDASGLAVMQVEGLSLRSLTAQTKV